jgi:large subunit ribosomal protein L25
MAEGFALKAEVRERTGKGAARALRREGLIPAVIYGNNQPPIAIAVPWKEMTMALYAGGFKTHVWSIDVGGQTIQALARDYQREVVKDRLVHVDFLRVSARSRVTVNVPVHFTDEAGSPGLKAGGVLNIVAHSVAVECAATAIPEHLDISLAGREIGDTIRSSDVSLPSGVNYIADDAFTIATIAAPRVETESDGEAEPEAADEADGSSDADAED